MFTLPATQGFQGEAADNVKDSFDSFLDACLVTIRPLRIPIQFRP